LKEKALECTGFKALYLAALDSNVSLITGVPGYPINSIMKLFLDKTTEKGVIESKTAIFRVGHSDKMLSSAYSARWLTNEKVAFEITLGASISGKRGLVIVKHVGMNILSDPLITSVTHTIGAGLVIIVGDDPGAKGSQNEQDSRWYGRIAEIVVFDPTDPDTAYRALRRAYDISEETRTPVILRVTQSLGKSEGKITRLPRSSSTPPEFDRSIWKNRMGIKHQLFHSRVYPLMEAEAENTDLNRTIMMPEEETEYSLGSRRIGIISSGFTSSIVEKMLKKRDIYCEISHLALNIVNPLPIRKIGTFIKNNQRLLVAEESEPFIEEQIRIAGRVCGKKTGHIPYGQVTSEDIEFALEHIDEEEVSKFTDTASFKFPTEGRITICDNCPYLPLYNFLSKINVWIAGDMGCSVRSAPEPLAAVDVSFALGSAISVACGFEKKSIAVIGDFALAHSGILGLLNAVTFGCDMLVLVLQNDVAAMTGGQEAPDIRKVVETITPDVSVFNIDEGKALEKMEIEQEVGYKIKEQILNPVLSELIQTKLALPGISVIYLKGKCRKY